MPSPSPAFLPANDGVDHVNIYSRGRTELGRLLSHFATTPFDVAPHGRFACLEAYWYWLQCEEGPERERLRVLSGFAAKRAGRALRTPHFRLASELEFRRCIARATREKIRCTPRLASALRACTLPLTHDYVYAGRPVTPQGNDWVLEVVEFFRNRLQSPRAAVTAGHPSQD